jgi:hypothetical protein
MPPEHGSVIDGALRQSALKTYDQCPARAVAEATRTFTDYSSGPASLGTAFHLFMEEFLRTLRRQGETSMPTEEAVNIMREVIAGRTARTCRSSSSASSSSWCCRRRSGSGGRIAS